MMTVWGGAFCVFASSLCLKGLCNCLPAAAPEGTVLPPQHSQAGICLPLPQLRELLEFNTLGRDLINSKASTLLLICLILAKGKVKGRLECIESLQCLLFLIWHFLLLYGNMYVTKKDDSASIHSHFSSIF